MRPGNVRVLFPSGAYFCPWQKLEFAEHANGILVPDRDVWICAATYVTLFLQLQKPKQFPFE